MKTTFFIIFFLFILGSCSKKTSVKTSTVVMNEAERYTDTNGRTQLIGLVQENDLETEPFSSWFIPGKDNYNPNPDVINQLSEHISDFDIEVFFGTWCGDSKREIPHFYAIMDQLDYDKSQMKVFAVGNSGNLYKKTPDGDTEGKNITNVPTFIFYKNGVEVNRIVEHVMSSSLEEDMLQIVSGEDYKDYYAN